MPKSAALNIFRVVLQKFTANESILSDCTAKKQGGKTKERPLFGERSLMQFHCAMPGYLSKDSQAHLLQTRPTPCDTAPAGLCGSTKYPHRCKWREAVERRRFSHNSPRRTCLFSFLQGAALLFCLLATHTIPQEYEYFQRFFPKI